MTTVTIEQAQAKLPEIIKQLQPGEEMVITDQGQPLARVKKAERTSWPCKAGSAENEIRWIAPDFESATRGISGVYGMSVLIDTHTLLWFLKDDPQLSATAKRLIEDPQNRKLVSVASCWGCTGF